MTCRILLACLAVLLLLPSSLAAESFAGVPLGMSSDPAELEAFEGYALDLDASGDPSLARLAESARAALDAVRSHDVEAFLAAKVVHDYRHQTLADAQRALQVEIRSQTVPTLDAASGIAALGDLQKINVYYGCGAQLQCDNGSTISCSCGNPYGTCYYNPNANSWGGKVDCDCAGSSFDVVKSCPYVPTSSCSPGCRLECGPTGGQCSSGVCYCY
ncbi:MAG: hypothetical protein AAGC60_09895 [Acidobacteriota bacterium]